MRSGKIMFGIDVAAPGLKQFIFRVQQVEQAALADLELLLVSATRFLDRHAVLPQEIKLLLQLGHIVVSNCQNHAYVAANLVALISGSIQALEVLLHPRTIRPAAEQVPVHHHLGCGVAVLARNPANIAVAHLGKAKIHSGLVSCLARVKVVAGSAHVFHRRQNGRM
ncbi:MAG: hypothetical protein A3F73_13280 [Gallionellales bacterium RIFCSPLOWO2_12_FULL_59_22]|nr:MAG: hypothetical protein A3F73_13280 [Gallionellales bacterium RIFCSPLOWO2_12_FULL_59_22]